MRTSRELPLQLGPAGELPLFLRISRAIAHDIRRGRLRPGAALPGSRALAKSLEVHRNTVLAAFRELEAEGWIVTSAAKGTFVSSALPERPARRFSADAPAREQLPVEPGFSLHAPRVSGAFTQFFSAEVLNMGGGVPDVRLAPIGELVRAFRRAVSRHRGQVLNYAEAAGHPRLRAALARHLSDVRGVAARAENILVTRGSQMALDLLARELVRPGEVVAVESFGYRPAWEALRLAGAELVAVPVDADGIDVARLEALCERRRVRAVYVTPHHQYPTTRVLSAARRLALLALARRRRLAILEDDYDHEFHFDGRPVLPLASADTDGLVVYVGTLSKLFAPGLRIGFAVAPERLVERLAGLRQYVDRQGDQAMEAAMAELIEDGELERHGRRACRVYRERRDVLVEALRKAFGARLSFEPPRGGMAMWVGVDAAIDPDAWARESLARGVGVHPGSRFTFDQRAVQYLRLGYGAHDAQELRDGVRRLEAALPAANATRVKSRRLMVKPAHDRRAR